MRFLVVGLVLIGAGIGVTEYGRRHPGSSSAAASVPGAKKKVQAQATPPTMKALMETVPAEPDAPGGREAFAAAVQKLTSAEKSGGFSTLLAGNFTVRELVSGEAFGVAVVGVGAQSGLVRFSAGAQVTVVAARAAAVTAAAINGSTVIWAEGARVYSAGESGEVKVLVQWANASVASLAASGGSVYAALVPKDGDPFSTDPTGAVVKIGADGQVSPVVTEQVRPHSLVVHGSDVFFVAGYPSALTRAALDGSFSAQIADRADGPIAYDGEGVVYRFPQTEVRRVAPAGGGQVTLAHGDIDWLSSAAGVTYFTSVGIGARLYQVTGTAEPVELVALNGVAKGVAMAGQDVAVAVLLDDGNSAIRLR